MSPAAVPTPARRATNRSTVWLRRALLALGALGIAGLAVAETHALILTIGKYPHPSAVLRGADADARMARQMVRLMGATHVVAMADNELDFPGLMGAVQGLQARVRPGDRLIVYFSGHGIRRTRGGAPGCQVSLVSSDGRFYADHLLQADLQALARVASHVVVFNDSCHAAGAVPQFKGLTPPEPENEMQMKSYPEALEDAPLSKAGRWGRGPSQAEVDDECAQISNATSKALRDLAPEDKFTYLAAAGPDQAAWSGPEGSLATRAWTQCLSAPGRDADRNRDGHIDGRELALCANGVLERQFRDWKQTVMPQFNVSWPLMPAPRPAR